MGALRFAPQSLPFHQEVVPIACASLLLTDLKLTDEREDLFKLKTLRLSPSSTGWFFHKNAVHNQDLVYNN